ncbi:transcriptional regulator, MarR family [Rathayibacter oskolensis]|uniref:Transcriptional regulator, MarR family n=1 Tax=Rathayibacter oskolensis TaxID=1891671 RepID=A0A1X7P0T0_9MICO|nr:MarR family winged helix-turn-helix transcriptional regulator [Rathayibacter oskolensis]SMH44237.1 transcriptional regulator, MarR family [Rathayibacter oskolensis]
MSTEQQGGPPAGSPYTMMTDDQVRAWYAYMKVQLRLRYEMNRQLQADSDLSLADYDVLVALTSEPSGVMRMAALATRLGWERSRTSHHVRRMQRRSLVATATASDDRRATDVSLTPGGWRALREATPSHVELVRTLVLDALDPDDLARLADIMERVYERVIEHGTLPRPVDHP